VNLFASEPTDGNITEADKYFLESNLSG